MAARMLAKRVYENGNRFYQMAEGGARYPSVTSVLGVLDKGGLTNWAVGLGIDDLKSNVKNHMATGELSSQWLEEAAVKARQAPDRFRDGAAEFGTRAHDAIDALVQGRDPGAVADDIRPVVDGFRRWQEQSGLTIDPRGDTMVASNRYQYAGALDALATDAEGRVHIIDFKTSNSVHSSYALQLAAYVYAFAEMYTNGEIDAPEGAVPHPPSAADGSMISSFAPEFAPAYEPTPAAVGSVHAAPAEAGVETHAQDSSQSDEDELPPWLQTIEVETAGAPQGKAAHRSAEQTAQVQKRTVVRNRSPSASKTRGSSVFGSPAGVGAVRTLCSSSGEGGDEGPEQGVDLKAYPISALAAGATLREAATGVYATGSGKKSPLLLSGRVVRFDKRTGNAHEHMVGDLSVSFNAFKAALYLWRVNNMQSDALLSR